MQNMNQEYDVIVANNVQILTEFTNKALDKGWQLAGGLFTYTENRNRERFFAQPIIKITQPTNLDQLFTREEMKKREEADKKFERCYANLSQKTKDLLEINGIHLGCKHGQLFTVFQNKRIEGILPTAVLDMLKQSEHCPIDLDSTAFLNEIEGLL